MRRKGLEILVLAEHIQGKMKKIITYLRSFCQSMAGYSFGDMTDTMYIELQMIGHCGES